MSFNDFSSLDSTVEAVAALDPETLDVRAVEAAHAEGLREHRAKTWVSCWTIASERYDHFGSATAEGPYVWRGKELRRVLMHPAHADQQRARYASGFCGGWDEDPRDLDRQIAEGVVRARVERFARTVRFAAGCAWLASLSDDELRAADDDEDAVDELLRGFGLTWGNLRAEQERRREARAAAERAAEWARCRALVPDGATLIDEGTPGFRNGSYWVPGRPKDAWRGIGLLDYGRTDLSPDAVPVMGEGREVGPLSYVAEQIANGSMRLARPDEHVPPRKVVERIGCAWDEVERFASEKGDVWAGRSWVRHAVLVLDDDAKVVRSKAIRAEAERRYLDRVYAKRDT